MRPLSRYTPKFCDMSTTNVLECDIGYVTFVSVPCLAVMCILVIRSTVALSVGAYNSFYGTKHCSFYYTDILLVLKDYRFEIKIRTKLTKVIIIHA